jgi:hypothetical protein
MKRDKVRLAQLPDATAILGLSRDCLDSARIQR